MLGRGNSKGKGPEAEMSIAELKISKETGVGRLMRAKGRAIRDTVREGDRCLIFVLDFLGRKAMDLV